jgi:Holliday junction resolvasome RuvABC DNA-binding subunit
LELKDKMGLPELGATAGGRGTGAAASAEATEALLSMGFSSAEVSAALKGFDGDPSDAQALLRHALRRLGGAGA